MVIVSDFDFSRIPKIVFGVGKFNLLARIISEIGNNALILTGSQSLMRSGKFDILINSLKNRSVNWYHRSVTGEPSPALIDDMVSEINESSVDVVIAIGGGSVIDAGKAVSAMLGKGESVFEYLEGVSSKVHNGKKLPFIAVPTTAGTGSEATKNAVLSQVGKDGFKRSLRHENFVPDIALIDPQLSVSCPSDVTAACGMDAFTQLLESYVSTKASPMTDALAYSGIKVLKDNLLPAASFGGQDQEVRATMSYASLLSGITLANAGLGVVHGLASPIGGLFRIPHGVVCGTLIGVATRVNISHLFRDKEANIKYLTKYADIGKLLSGDHYGNVEQYCEHLIEKIEEWTNHLQLPRLEKYSIQHEDIEEIVESTDNKNNPVRLDKESIKQILVERI